MDTSPYSGHETAELSSLPTSDRNIVGRISDNADKPETHEAWAEPQEPAKESCLHGPSTDPSAQHASECPPSQPTSIESPSAGSAISVGVVPGKHSVAILSTRGRMIPFPVASIAPVIHTDEQETRRPEPMVRERGKSMSRRRGQNGHLEQSGKWWVIRFWMDVPGQEKRALKRVKVCPISGSGSLSKSARERRAKEIIIESGADTEEHFNKVVRPQQQNPCVTFREQSEIWFAARQARKRKPVAPETLRNNRSALDNWLIPTLGERPLSEVGNTAAKLLITAMSKADLSAATIVKYVKQVKLIVASAVDSEGEEELYPRKWNSEFMDLPVIDKSTQNTPSFQSETMSALAQWRHGVAQMIFIFCGAGGFRIGEALGVEIDKHISPDFRTITIEQEAINGKLQYRLKTANAYREVDLHSSVAALLKHFVGGRTSGFLFQSRNGSPLSLPNILGRHLHSALKELGYSNCATGTHKAGSHAFRRFRDTHLRNNIECPCPPGLLKFWMGHAPTDMTDHYDKIRYDRMLRLEWAEKCGIGFKLPPRIEPNVPKNAGRRNHPGPA